MAQYIKQVSSWAKNVWSAIIGNPIVPSESKTPYERDGEVHKAS
jgi:hypothetical protein